MTHCDCCNRNLPLIAVLVDDNYEALICRPCLDDLRNEVEVTTLDGI